VLERRESEGGEEDGDPLNELSGTRGEEGSERQDEEDREVVSRSMSNCGESGAS